MTKDELRRAMRTRLKGIGAEREQKSRLICESIAAHSAFQRSRRVALFSPLPSEPDLNALWSHGGRQFCYPRVSGEKIEFIAIAALEDLVESPWNPWVREPAVTANQIVNPAEIGLVLVPGLAFTRDGWRLGRGGGFYDRFLAELPASSVKLGVCFEVQIVESLPAETHDQRMDVVVTEVGAGS